MGHRSRLRTGKKKNGQPLIPTPEQVKALMIFFSANNGNSNLGFGSRGSRTEPNGEISSGK